MVGLIITFTVMFIVLVIITILWVNAITDMKINHPDYKGEDFYGDDGIQE